MKTKTNLKTALISAAVVLLVASSAQLSASDYRIWREQVPLSRAESSTVGVIGGEEGSWFFKEIVKTHKTQQGWGQVGKLNGGQTSSISVSENWFIHAVAPNFASVGLQTDETDIRSIGIALDD